jgi:hypothetical protein
MVNRPVARYSSELEEGFPIDDLTESLHPIQSGWDGYHFNLMEKETKVRGFREVNPHSRQVWR